MKLKTLAVDNHPLMLKFLEKSIQSDGHEIKTAEDGLQALAILNTYTPDVMFIDMVMPYIDGEKLLRIIRSRPSLESVYTVILSGMDADVNQTGADAFIPKTSFGKMNEHVKSILDHVILKKQNAGEGVSGKIIYDLQKSREVVQVTRELFLSKRHLEIIFNNMAEAILELVKDSIIVTANKAAVRLLGVSEEELLATDFFSYFSEMDKEKLKQQLAAQETKKNAAGDIIVTINKKRLSAKIFPVETENGNTMIAILNDVTDVDAYEKKIHVRDEKIKLIAANTSDIFFITDTDMKLSYVSPSIRKLTGYGQDEIKAIEMENLFAPLSYNKLRQMDLKEMSPKRLELCMKKKDGTNLWIEIVISQIKDNDGVFSGIIGILRDIAGKKKEEAKRLYHEKLKGVLEMARAACHELGQPLQIIKGNTEMLQMDLEKEGKSYEEIENIISELDRMTVILQKLRRITKYVSREYINGKPIVDIEKSSG